MNFNIKQQKANDISSPETSHEGLELAIDETEPSPPTGGTIVSLTANALCACLRGGGETSPRPVGSCQGRAGWPPIRSVLRTACTKWCTMMWPRLRRLRELSGVVKTAKPVDVVP